MTTEQPMANPIPTGENPFRLHAVMESLRSNASTAELGILRQISATYNQFMSPTYFDQLKKTIFVRENNDFGIFDKDKMWCNVCCQEAIIKPITRETWDPFLFAPLFRIIHIHEYFHPCASTHEINSNAADVDRFENRPKSNFNILELLQSCGPFITKLKFDAVALEAYYTRDYLISQVSEVVGVLPNLELVVFQMDYLLGHGVDSRNFFIEKLMPLIENIQNPSTTILWKYTPSHQEAYDEFSTWIESPRVRSLRNPIFFEFEIDNEPDSLETQEFTLFVLKHVRYVQKLRISVQWRTMDIYKSYPGHLKNCINILSSYLTYIHINVDHQLDNYEEVVNPSCKFPKLKQLSIFNLDQNLEFLKSCTNLKTLILEIEQSKIFCDPGKSDKENIKLCFGNLRKLQKFVMWYNKEDKIQDGNELGIYLRSILPVDDAGFELVPFGDESKIY